MVTEMKVKWFLPGESFLLDKKLFSRVTRFYPVKTLLPGKVLPDEKVFTENILTCKTLLLGIKFLPFYSPYIK